MSTRLADPWAPRAPVVCNFSWYDQNNQPFSNITYTVDGVNYPPAGAKFQASVTPLGLPVTFDAIDQFKQGLPHVVVPVGIQVISYQWDLGNGQTATGPQATTTYSYTTPPPDAATTLTVVDSIGRRYSTTHPLNLQSLTPIYGSFGRTI